MAEYIRFRLNAAKIGVSMALLALIAGVADKAKANASAPTASASSVGGFLKLTGLSKTVSSDFLKLEQKWLKLDNALGAFEAKLLKFERSVSTQYYKSRFIDTTFLKIDAANATFLKITDANFKYLKIDGTAANASELGGLKPDAFVQGRGGVVTGGTPFFADGSVRNLLQSPDGKLGVTLTANSDQITVHVTNNTGLLLPAVMVPDEGAAPGVPVSMDLKPGENTFVLVGLLRAHHVQLQTFGDGSAAEAMTLVISTEGTAGSQTGGQAVGQMLIGLL